MRKIFLPCAMVAALFAASSAQAVTISLDPASTSTVAGSNFSLDVLADFSSTEIIAGSVEFSFDSSLLAYTDFSWDSDFTSLFAFPILTVESSNIVSIGFGALPESFGTGNGHTIGTINFDALAAGSASVDMTVSSLHGDFQDSDYNVVNATFENASVDISAVPVPAAAWLFGSGLLGLAGIARRRSA